MFNFQIPLPIDPETGFPSGLRDATPEEIAERWPVEARLTELTNAVDQLMFDALEGF